MEEPFGGEDEDDRAFALRQGEGQGTSEVTGQATRSRVPASRPWAACSLSLRPNSFISDLGRSVTTGLAV